MTWNTSQCKWPLKSVSKDIQCPTVIRLVGWPVTKATTASVCFTSTSQVPPIRAYEPSRAVCKVETVLKQISKCWLSHEFQWLPHVMWIWIVASLSESVINRTSWYVGTGTSAIFDFCVAAGIHWLCCNSVESCTLPPHGSVSSYSHILLNTVTNQ